MEFERSSGYNEKIEGGSKKETWDTPLDFKADQEGMDLGLTLEIIELFIRNKENHLGSGGAGKVFTMGDQCIKVMVNRHSKPQSNQRYKLGNSPEQEFAIQTMLNNFEVEGVFSPRTLRCYVGDTSAAIVMEELKAVNLQMVLSGKEELPDCFDLEDFFSRLEEYTVTMHDEKRIVHNDLEARNIMIDLETGYPRVIDFGKSSVGQSDFSILAKKDLQDIEDAYGKTKLFIDKKRNIVYSG
jgi:RIO-like serine/threonine protein kinase